MNIYQVDIQEEYHNHLLVSIQTWVWTVHTHGQRSTVVYRWDLYPYLFLSLPFSVKLDFWYLICRVLERDRYLVFIHRREKGCIYIHTHICMCIWCWWFMFGCGWRYSKKFTWCRGNVICILILRDYVNACCFTFPRLHLTQLTQLVLRIIIHEAIRLNISTITRC